MQQSSDRHMRICRIGFVSLGRRSICLRQSVTEANRSVGSSMDSICISFPLFKFESQAN